MAQSGMEMMLASLLAKAGIDVRKVTAMVEGAADAVHQVNSRLAAIEKQNAELQRQLSDLAARLQFTPGGGANAGTAVGAPGCFSDLVAHKPVGFP